MYSFDKKEKVGIHKNLMTDYCPFEKKNSFFGIKWTKKCGVRIKNEYGRFTSVANCMKQPKFNQEVRLEIIRFQKQTNISCKECLEKMELMVFKEENDK